jgi:hypothetical protein
MKNLFGLQLKGSKERKSLSGAIKSSFATSNEFWAEVLKVSKMKKADFDPKFIVSIAAAKDLKAVKKGVLIEKTVWSAWSVENIVRRYAVEKFGQK